MGKVLHASASGYFPFCIEEAPEPTEEGSVVGSGTTHPLGMSLENAMKLYWRIKKIKLTTPRASATALAESTKQSEKFLVCTPNPIAGTASYFTTEIFRFTDISVFFQTPFIYKYNDLYYPNFSLSFIDQEIDPVGPTITNGQFFTNKIEIDYSVYSTYNFLGLGEVDLYAFNIIGSPELGSVEVDEYWSYGGTYNTSTGLPL
jgi:hypothetical protein